MTTSAQLNPDNRDEARGVARGFLTCLAIEAAAFLIFAGGLYLFWCK